MAIQFLCTHCHQPIEVDDEYAGQSATCPYCRHAVAVPFESTYRPQSAAVARPSPVEGEVGRPASVPPPPIATQPGFDVPARRQAAETFGKYALLCMILALLLFGTFMAVAMVTAVQLATSQPTGVVDPNNIQQEMQSRLLARPWLIAMEVGGIFFALAGLALGIVSLVQAPHANPRGTLAVIVCGLMLLCVCTSTILSLATGLGA